MVYSLAASKVSMMESSKELTAVLMMVLRVLPSEVVSSVLV